MIEIIFYKWFNQFNPWDIITVSLDEFDNIQEQWNFALEYSEYNKLILIKNNEINKNIILDYIEEQNTLAEENQRTIKDYIKNDEWEPDDMTPKEKYDSDLNQRNEDLKKVINLINNL